MLGSLQSDLNKLGVATVAKGVCGACKKPIAGQVMRRGGALPGGMGGRVPGAGAGLGPESYELREDSPWACASISVHEVEMNPLEWLLPASKSLG